MESESRVQVREYEAADAAPLMALFHATVHAICRSDYTPEQLAAWSPESGQQVALWKRRFESTKPFVAVAENGPVGFLELGADGHIDCLYVRHDRQRRGVGTLLLEHALANARRRSIRQLDAEVSITAVPIFTCHGFVTVRAQEVERNGHWLKNFVMKRTLAANRSE